MIQASTAEPRLAMYARVSSDEQKEGQTIDSQVAELERFAAEREWFVVGIYKDEGWSGAVMARPELDRLRDDAQKGLLDIVLINDVDRLARDVTHLGIIKRDLESRGVQVVFRKLPSETSPTYNLMVNILGSFAEFEREMIADRMRRGRRHKVEARHQFIGTIPSFGYRYFPKDRRTGAEGRLETNPDEASVVRQVFDWVDREGLSARKVVKRLNDRGVPPRKGGLHWQQSSVFRLLHNEMYAGVWHYNKNEGCEPRSKPRMPRYRRHVKSSMRLRAREKWIALELPAELTLISRDQWTRVQEQLQRNKTFSPRREIHKYFLKSLVRCAGCGARMVGEPNKQRYAYRCHARCKKVPSVKEERLNDVVWNKLVEAILNPEIMRKGIELRRSALAKADLRTQALNSESEHAVRQIEGEEVRILAAYRQSVITSDQLARELEMLKDRRSRLAGAVSVTPEQRPFEIPDAPLQQLAEIARRNLDGFGFEERRAFVRLLVDEVVFDGRTARIRGILPNPLQIGTVDTGTQNDSPSYRISRLLQGNSPAVTANSDHIATAGVHSCGINPESAGNIATSGVYSCGTNPDSTLLFELNANL